MRELVCARQYRFCSQVLILNITQPEQHLRCYGFVILDFVDKDFLAGGALENVFSGAFDNADELVRFNTSTEAVATSFLC